MPEIVDFCVDEGEEFSFIPHYVMHTLVLKFMTLFKLNLEGGKEFQYHSGLAVK